MVNKSLTFLQTIRNKYYEACKESNNEIEELKKYNLRGSFIFYKIYFYNIQKYHLLLGY